MIKNIIFDLGGIIIDIDEGKIREYLLRHAFKLQRIKKLHSLLLKEGLLDKFEKGQISEQEFIASFAAVLKGNDKDSFIRTAWNSMIIGIPKKKAELLTYLRPKLRVFILSNTNSIHVAYFNEILQQNYGISNFSEICEKAYYSYEMGLRKPDPGIFSSLLNDSSLLAEETLFIDDNTNNTEAAAGLGINVMHCLQEEDLIGKLKENRLTASIFDEQ